MHTSKDNIKFSHTLIGYEQAINTQKYELAVMRKADGERNGTVSTQIASKQRFIRLKKKRLRELYDKGM